LLLFGEHERELSGAEAATTNNRMELTAVIRALEALKRPVQGRLYTDSQYVRQGVLEWVEQWKARGWKTADKKPVKNQDLWQVLDDLVQRHDLEWHWVKGHSGNAATNASTRSPTVPSTRCSAADSRKLPRHATNRS